MAGCQPVAPKFFAIAGLFHRLRMRTFIGANNLIYIRNLNSEKNGFGGRFELYYAHGIMELWNDGIMGFKMKSLVLNIIAGMNVIIYPILPFPKTHNSGIPVFHHIPRA